PKVIAAEASGQNAAADNAQDCSPATKYIMNAPKLRDGSYHQGHWSVRPEAKRAARRYAWGRRVLL
ncbi:hypothetical protein H4R34_005873, partial [Dimargaris verticillata]